MATPIIHFAGQTFEPLPSGALLLARRARAAGRRPPSRKAELVRQARLAAAALRHRHDADAARRRSRRTPRAETVISLGDSFHRDEGTTTLLDADRLQLDGLTDQAQWIWLSGNHDPRPHALGGKCLPHLEHRGLTFTHHPRRGVACRRPPPSRRARRDQRPLGPPRLLRLRRRDDDPAGLRLVDRQHQHPLGAVRGLFDWPTLEVTMLGRDRLYPVSRKRLVEV